MKSVDPKRPLKVFLCHIMPVGSVSYTHLTLPTSDLV